MSASAGKWHSSIGITLCPASDFVLTKPSLPCFSEMELHVVAVVPGVRRRYSGLYGRIFQLANALKLVAQDLSFGLKLFFVRDVLIVAAAAKAADPIPFPGGRGTKKCGQRGSIRSGEASNTSISSPRAKPRFSSTSRMRTFSPGKAKGTKVALPIRQASEGFAAIGKRIESQGFFLCVIYFYYGLVRFYRNPKNSSIAASRASISSMVNSPICAMRKVLPFSAPYPFARRISRAIRKAFKSAKSTVAGIGYSSNGFRAIAFGSK